MLRYFNATIKIPSDKKVAIRALESLLSINEESIFVFPFCLFFKSFYVSLKDQRQRPHIGYVMDGEFEFNKTIYYGNFSSGSQTSRLLKIKGLIKDRSGICEVKLGFYLTTFNIVLEIIIMVGCIIAILIYKNMLFVVILIVLAIDILNFTLKNYIKIKHRIQEFKII